LVVFEAGVSWGSLAGIRRGKQTLFFGETHGANAWDGRACGDTVQGFLTLSA